MTSENGLTGEVCGQSAYEAYRHALGFGKDWAQIPEDEQEAWEHVGELAIALIEGADGLAFTQLADKLNLQYLKVRNLPPNPLASQDLKFQLAWEAAGRHLANLIDSDEGYLNPGEHEPRWRQWAKDKLAKLQGV